MCIAILFTSNIYAQKNKATLYSTCDKYIVDDSRVKIVARVEFPIFDKFIDVIDNVSKDTVFIRYKSCKNLIPIVFENGISSTVRNAIDKSFNPQFFQREVVVEINEFRIRKNKLLIENSTMDLSLDFY